MKCRMKNYCRMNIFLLMMLTEGEIIIHTIFNTEGPGEIQAEKDKLRKQFLETAEEFKRLSAQLEKNPKRLEAFNLGVDSLTKYFA